MAESPASADHTANTRRDRITQRRVRPHALELLRDNHRRIAAMFRKFERCQTDAPRARIADAICQSLIVLISDASPEGHTFIARVRLLAAMHERHLLEQERRDGMFAEATSAGLDFLALGERLRAHAALLRKRLPLLRWKMPGYADAGG